MLSGKKITIAVIGAGSSGICAFNSCKENGLDVKVFEMTDEIGGQWTYRENCIPGCTSIYDSLISAHSKECTAFSNFPPPNDYPNILPHSSMAKYVNLFARKIKFNECVRFKHEVINCEHSDDYEQTGKWKLTIKDNFNNIFVKEFDGVAVCTGQTQKLTIPEFEDQDIYNGEILHSHDYKSSKSFIDKKVVVVGFGVTAGDITVDLVGTAKKVYMSVRSGTWITKRLFMFGLPMDILLLRRFFFSVLPIRFMNFIMETILNFQFNHHFFGIKPEHRFTDQLAFLVDHLPLNLMCGKIKLEKKIERFTKNGVIFEGNNFETTCDSVILATGYNYSWPFLEKNLDNFKIHDLYEWMFYPHQKHPHTLAIIGLNRTNGATIAVCEQQSRLFALLMAEKLKNLDKDKMLKSIKKSKIEIEKKFPLYKTKLLDCFWIDRLDRLAELIGNKPNLWRYFFTDIKLWIKLFFGPCLPYHYRLEGPNAWIGAREAILTVEHRMKAPFSKDIL